MGLLKIQKSEVGMEKPTVVITDLSTERITYYQWFLYGLMLLSRGGIRLKFDLPWAQRLYVVNHAERLCFLIAALRALKWEFFGRVEDRTKGYLRGYVMDSRGKHYFCIDSSDSPNMFNGELLRDSDTYFKMQCPKELDERGFKIGNFYIPFFDSEYENPADKGKPSGKRKLCPEVYLYSSKIKPLMTGPRNMGRGCSFRQLDASYKNLLTSRSVGRTGKAMCYFGNSAGPRPMENVTEPDWDNESSIMGWFGDGMNHPNEKRAKIADIMETLGEGYDARVIHRGNSDTGRLAPQNRDLIIPRKDFSKYVAKFQYNINVSGYRTSIPNRFIESFVCGTAVATDNLHVKWYHPFGEEVVELGEMGYLPDSEVDYEEVRHKLENLRPVSKEYVIAQYERYWAPDKVAEYMIDAVRSSTPVDATDSQK